MSERSEEVKSLAAQALEDDSKLAQLADDVSGASRRQRQMAAAVFSQISKDEPKALVPYMAVIIDALNRPEAQTRWECLDALTQMVEHDSRGCEKALAGAEAALFDEDSGPVRLSAMRFLCKLGSTTANRSTKVWPLIDEGIQCYHGDLEFNEMLTAITDFSTGKLDPQVKEALASRMSFDATNGKGALKRRAQQIVDNVSA